MQKSTFILVYCALAVAGLFEIAAAASLQRTYTNPVGGKIRMGDPFVLHYGDRYYLYGTTAGDGFKCYSSANLVDWKPLGYAYRKTNDSWGGKTYWAPEVVHYKDKFYMVFSCQPAESKEFSTRICLAVSDKPQGPFEDYRAPLFDLGYSCIDGDIFVDDDGTAYLFFDKVGSVGEPWKGTGYLYGIIYAVKLKDDLSAIAGEPVKCIEADAKWELSVTPGHTPTRCNEGAFAFRHKQRYYMTYSANHYADPQYGIGYATAPSPLGAWTKSGDNPLLKKNLRIGVSGPGHSCITTSPDGKEMFIVYHAHADVRHPSGDRTVNIDRLVFDKEGNLKLLGPTRSPQPMPSGAD